MSLDKIIPLLIEEAMIHRGQYQTAQLSRGLVIKTRLKDGVLFFGISRAGQYPSIKEWDICIQRIPDYIKLPNSPPSEIIKKNIFWLYQAIRVK